MSTDTTITQKIETAVANTHESYKANEDQDILPFYASAQAQNATEAYKNALAAIEERSEGWKFDWSSVGEAMSAEAAIKFWYDVVATSSPSEDELTITKEGLTEVLMPRVRKLLRNSGGQSTSAISNEQDRVEADLTARLLSSFGTELGIPKGLIW